MTLTRACTYPGCYFDAVAESQFCWQHEPSKDELRQSIITAAREGRLLDAYLVNIDLQGAELKNADLRNCNFTGAYLEGVDFSGALMDGAILERAHLAGAKFENAQLRNCNFNGAFLHAAECNGMDAAGTEFNYVSGRNLQLKGAQLTDTSWQAADLAGGRFDEADCTRMHAPFLVAHRSTFVKAKLHSANLGGAKLLWTDLADADCYDCNLAGTDFSFAKAVGAVFPRARMGLCNMYEMDLTSASLDGAIAREANFQSAILDGTTFNKAVLQRAMFKNTDVSDEQLESAGNTDGIRK